MDNENNNNSPKDDAKIYLETLLNEGNTIPVDDDVDTYEIHLPSFYDEKLFKRGQRYYKTNIWSMFLGKLCGLLAILAIPTILDILVFTKQSGTSKTAYRRYIATIFHTLNWYKEDLKPGTNSWKSLEAVRKRHVRISRFSNKSNTGLITQKDMAITQFGFIGYILLKQKQLGIVDKIKDIEAFVHFWRVIGYMIGIEERFNVCTESYVTTKARLEVISNEILKPSLENPPKMFYEMVDALITGLWCFNPALNTNAFIYFTKRLTDVPGYYYFESELEVNEIKPITILNNVRTEETGNIQKKSKNLLITMMSYWARYVLFNLVVIHEILFKSFLVRWWFNSQMILSHFLIKNFPFLAFYKFGIRDAYVRILKGGDS